MLPPKPPTRTPEKKEDILLYLNELQRYNELVDVYVRLMDLRPGSQGDVGFGKDPKSKIDINLSTQDLEIVDAGTVGATEQSWVEVKVNGVQGFLRIYSTK